MDDESLDLQTQDGAEQGEEAPGDELEEQNELTEGCLLRVAGYAGLVVGALLAIGTNETELGTFLMGLGALILIAGQIASLRR